MDLRTLDQLLVIDGGKLRLAADTVPECPLGPLLTAYNGGMPITIDGAAKAVGATDITVTGSTPFMNVAGLPVVGQFTLDGAGNPVVTLRFTLVGETPEPSPWRFSQSFGDLPAFVNGEIEIKLLDELNLSGTTFVLTTGTCTDPVSGVRFTPGLNFVSTLRPSGLLGLLDTALGGDPSTTLFGRIVMPTVGQSVAPLPRLTYPWQTASPVPGIHLEAPLGLRLDIANITLGDSRLRLYSPLSKAWLEEHPDYSPIAAVTGKLTLSDTGIAGETVAIVSPGAGEVVLGAQLDGVSLANLGRLAGLTGGDDLFGQLPDEIKQLGESLGGLSLERVGITLRAQLSAEAIAAVYVRVGMPKASWTAFTGFTVSRLAAEFVVHRPFATGRRVSVLLSGRVDMLGAPLALTAEVPNFNITAGLADQVSLPLTSFFQTYLPELPVTPPDLTINDLRLGIAPGQQYSLWAQMADNPPWTLDLGPVPLTIRDVSLELVKDASAGTKGSIGGTLVIADTLSVEARYDLSNDFMIRAELPGVKLSQLIARLDQFGIQLPDGFDIELKQSYMLVNKQGSTLTFTVATEVTGLGLMAFTAQKQGTQTGVALGIDVTGGLSAIKGLEALATLNDWVGLDRLMLVVSSLNQSGFQFPDMAAFNAPPLQGKNLKLPSQASGLVKGLNFYALLSAAKNKGLQTLAKYIGIKLDGSLGVTLAVSLPNPTQDSRLYFAAGAKIKDLITVDGRMGVMIRDSEVGAFLDAMASTDIQGRHFDFHVEAAVLPGGVLIGGSMLGTISFNPVQLSHLALVIGMDWEGVPSVGVAGTLDVGNFESSVALFFDSVDPSHSMFAGSISGVSLADVAKLLAGQGTIPPEVVDVMALFGLKGLAAIDLPGTAATALDKRDLPGIAAAFAAADKDFILPSSSDQVLLVVNQEKSTWHITDMTKMKHYSLKADGDRIHVVMDPQVYFVPQETRLTDQLKFQQGLRVTAEVDQYVIQTKLDVELFPSQGIAADAALSPITIYSTDFFSLTDAAGTGGPRLSLSTFNRPGQLDPKLQGPHFFVTGKLRLLGVDVASAYVTVSAQGLAFDFHEQVSSLTYADLKGSFTNLTDITASGDARVGVKTTLDLGGYLGQVPINVDVGGGLAAALKNGQPECTLTGHFEFQGLKVDAFTLSVGVDLKQLEKLVQAEVEKAVRSFLGVAANWLDWVGKGFVSGVQGAVQIAQALFHNFGQSAEQVIASLKSLNFSLLDVATAIKTVFSLSADTMLSLLRAAGYSLIDILRVLRDLFGLSPEAIAALLRNIGCTAEEAVRLMADLVGRDPTLIIRVLVAVAFPPAAIALALQQVLGLSPEDVAAALRSAGYGVDVIAGVLKDVFGLGGDAAGRILNALGLPGDQIARALKDVFGWSADQVAGFLKDVLGLSADAVKAILQGVGYALEEIEKVLRKIFDPSQW